MTIHVTLCQLTSSNVDYYYIFQINQGKLHRGKPFNGFANVFFTNPHHKGNVQGKYKKGFKLGKCFVLRDNQISEIRGNFVNDELVVSFQMICL